MGLHAAPSREFRRRKDVEDFGCRPIMSEISVTDASTQFHIGEWKEISVCSLF